MTHKALTLRLPIEQAEALEAIAGVDEISINEEIRRAISAHIEARRQDAEFRERLRASMERNREILERLLVDRLHRARRLPSHRRAHARVPAEAIANFDRIALASSRLRPARRLRRNGGVPGLRDQGRSPLLAPRQEPPSARREQALRLPRDGRVRRAKRISVAAGTGDPDETDTIVAESRAAS